MKLLYYVLFLSVFIISCSDKLSPEETAYIKKIEEHRGQVNEFMKSDPRSPFNFKNKVEFHELNYFDVNPEFVFKSKLYEYPEKDTVIIYGTKGEPRETIKYGYVKFHYGGEEYKVNVYESTGSDGTKYYSIWFTDKTTNKESYGVGRYLDFEKQDDPNYIYTIDFNLAYNPYCAYNPNYSCAIPSKEDYIPLEIRAGEKKFHN
ncbi:putative secreted protein [Melioribacter roseus P3M-2]|uniref:Putative secreted protein n=1 Tax=Melioribacter roseus (strain DSM 23840 / JCM 17771 / VKM B-2668 / P3M-2) TaxID=1191523 RepID=I6Z7M8_MELRP|nr:DUF1684 domain-containing protein [Melioribacter roseus]AFN75165.1 putative secreted protein [Melioribacter roseus P3M-2]